MSNSINPVLEMVESYLKVTGISASRFGREAVHDPRFVFDLRKGRCPQPALISRLYRVISAETPMLKPTIACEESEKYHL